MHPFESYLSFLHANGEFPDNVVTNISYDPNADSMELLFSPLRNVTDDEWHLVKKAQDLPDAKRYTQITVAQADNVAKLPPSGVVRADEPDVVVTPTVGAEPQVVTLKPPEEPIAEPVKKEVKKEEPPLKDDISAVLTAWADE